MSRNQNAFNSFILDSISSFRLHAFGCWAKIENYVFLLAGHKVDFIAPVFPLGTVLSRLQYAVSFENYKLKLIEISEEMIKNIYKKKKD